MSIFARRRRLITHAETGAIGKHACRDIHSEQFLEEQLCSVRDMDLGDASFVVAGAAFVEGFFELAVFNKR